MQTCLRLGSTDTHQGVLTTGSQIREIQRNQMRKHQTLLPKKEGRYLAALQENFLHL